jgi:beta-glucosidase/6-phospho-beta-glucosidase/beta-galactosidase
MGIKKGKYYKISFIDNFAIAKATGYKYGIVIMDNSPERVRWERGLRINIVRFNLKEISVDEAFLEAL